MQLSMISGTTLMLNVRRLNQTYHRIRRESAIKACALCKLFPHFLILRYMSGFCLSENMAHAKTTNVLIRSCWVMSCTVPVATGGKLLRLMM